MEKLTELEMLQISGGQLPSLKSDSYGSYWEWPDGSWVAIDWLA